MPFTEHLKLTVKKRAHFRCCICQAFDVEVHHIVPQAEGGPNTEDNAAPLCPSHHETYGANPQKRKLLREARDFWYEICEKRFASSSDYSETIANLIRVVESMQETYTALSEKIESLMNITNLVVDTEASLKGVQETLISLKRDV
jgi:hypothetical protein